MRLHPIALAFVLALATGDALAACDGCGGSRSTLKERQTFVPKRQEVRGTKVRTHITYCGGGASCGSTVVWRRNRESAAQHAARVAALKAEHEQGATRALADPKIAATIAAMHVEVYDVSYTVRPDELEHLRETEPRIRVTER